MTTNVTAISIRPFDSIVGAEVSGVNTAEPLSQEVQARLREAWTRHSLLLFRGQELDVEQQLRFARVFGELFKAHRSPEGFDYVSNMTEKGHNPYGDIGFHFDYSFLPIPSRGLMLYGIEVTPEGSGGETLLANVKLAYQTLPQALRDEIAGLTIRHGTPDQTKHVGLPGVEVGPNARRADHPLVAHHPLTGEPYLFLSPRHADRILDVSERRSKALIEELSGYLYRPENIFRHTWQRGDVIVWDNLGLQHGRSDFDRSFKRHLRRVYIGA